MAQYVEEVRIALLVICAGIALLVFTSRHLGEGGSIFAGDFALWTGLVFAFLFVLFLIPSTGYRLSRWMCRR